MVGFYLHPMGRDGPVDETLGDPACLTAVYPWCVLLEAFSLLVDDFGRTVVRCVLGDALEDAIEPPPVPVIE